MDITFQAERTPRTSFGLPRKVLLSLLVVGILGPLGLRGTMAALSPTASGSAGFAAGTVYLRSDTGGGALFQIPNAGPGSTATSYTTVSYDGTLPADVRLHAVVSGSGLDRFIEVRITRGTGTGPAFLPDAETHAGMGPGVIFEGTLADLPNGWEDGVADPGAWTAGESHSYQVEVTLSDDPSAQGLTADASFRWEARNR